MSKSNKARHGMRCKHWKDTVLASRSQKRAWAKKKRRDACAERRTGTPVNRPYRRRPQLPGETDE